MLLRSLFVLVLAVFHGEHVCDVAPRVVPLSWWGVLLSDWREDTLSFKGIGSGNSSGEQDRQTDVWVQ